MSRYYWLLLSILVLVPNGGVFSLGCKEARGQEDPLNYEQVRVAVTGFNVNRPDPYPGMGDFGWAGNIQRLPTGDLMLVHQWGYWHSSFAEPRMIESSLAKQYRKEGWPLDFKAPTGGRSMATLSSDNGKTWTKPRTLVDLPMDDSPNGLLRCQDGTLLCFMNVQASWYGYRKAPPELAHVLNGLNTQQCVIRSVDNGKTWTEPYYFHSPGKFYDRSHAQAIQLPEGAILWPTYSNDFGKLFGVIRRSDDSGKTWRIISTIHRRDKHVDEPAIAHFSDGQLIVVCRPDGGTFRSDDEGYNWSPVGQVVVDKGKFKAPWMTVLSDDTVVCVATLGHLRAWLSTDRGSSWTEPISLDPSCYGYPGGFKLEDESIITSYVERGAGKSRIFAIRFKVNDARDGIELLPLGEYTFDPDIDKE